MKTPSRQLHRWLMLAGTLPFLLGAGLLVLGISPGFLAVDATLLLKSYTLAIISFMAGVHWGQSFVQIERANLLRVLSNAFCLTPWFLMITGVSNTAFFIGSAMVFITLLAVDYRLERVEAISSDYLRARTTVTAVVCGSLVVSAIGST